MLTHRRYGIALLALLSAGLVAPASEADKYLPEDTESVIFVNFRQLLDSKLVKEQVGLDVLRAGLVNDEAIAKVLKDLGLDPLKDVHRLIVAQPSEADQDQGLMILRGKFDVEKIQTFMTKAAKDGKTVEVMKVKDLKGKEHTIYKVKLEAPADFPAPLPPHVYVGIPGGDAILGGFSKDYLLDAMQVKPGAKAKLKNKKFAAVLTKIDDNQTLAIGLLGEVIAKSLKGVGEAGLPLPDSVADTFKQLDAVVGGITLDDGIKLKFAMAAKTPKAARDLDKMITDGLNQGRLLLGLLATQEPKLQPVVDFVNSLKTSTSENVVTLKGGIDGDDLKKLFPKDQ